MSQKLVSDCHVSLDVRDRPFILVHVVYGVSQELVSDWLVNLEVRVRPFILVQVALGVSQEISVTGTLVLNT